MAAPLSRDWYNTLIDDDGSGTTGTIWNKTQVDGLLDTFDASLAGLVDTSGTPVANSLAVFSDGDTLRGNTQLRVAEECIIASNTADGADVNVTGMAGGGTSINNRGAYVLVGGNENASYPGGLILALGNVANANLAIARSNGGNALIVYGGTGIVHLVEGRLLFPAVQIPSADPTTLDDYREGLFTPFFTGSVGASGQVHSVQIGRYIKIGRLVTIFVVCNLAVLGTISGGVQIGGFPFPWTDYIGFPIGYWGGFSSTVTGLGARTVGNATVADLVVPIGGSQSQGLGQAGLTDLANINFTFSYIAAN